MFNRGRQSITAGDDSTNIIAGRDVLFLNRNIPTDIVDQRIDEDVWRLRKSRLFSEFDGIQSSLSLGRRLAEGSLSGGSDDMRGRGLAWCARILSRSNDLEQAEYFLKLARTLGDSPEIKIAEAAAVSRKGDKAAALQVLANIDTPDSRSAGLMIVAYHDGGERALKWMTDAGRTADHLDSDGKSFLLNHQLLLGYWDDAAATIGVLHGTDFTRTPILHHLAAVTTLSRAVPAEFRTAILTQPPFEAKGFPLSSDTVAMDARRVAHKHFLDAVEAAKQLGCPRAARTDDEYALWLELCDPAQSEHGRNRLISKLRDSKTSLGFVHYALQFGVKLDREAVERDIEQSIAVNGGMTIDAASARFALAFTIPTPEEAANYIARHYNQLAAHINSKLMRYRQIEMLSRAGLIEKANDILARLIEEGIPAEQEGNLRRIISEAQGCDPVESYKEQYKATRTLTDLMNLVDALVQHQHWDDLCEFGRLLFEQTHSLNDAERLVNAFSKTHRTEALVHFLKENADLLPQSKHLRIAYAWGLFNEGAFLESRAALAELEAGSQEQRTLTVNLGIATGNWASLDAYFADEYQNRDDRSARELIGTAQLALQLGSLHAKGLVYEAAAKAEDDPAVLVAAYSIATSAGWEGDPQVFQWLEKAAELSGADGPVRTMSLKDILDQKPEWDRHASETWRTLAEGQMPIFLAAQSLNRTLIDLTTFPALSNLSESDPRQRSAIPAYSGKRVPLDLSVRGKAVALDPTALLTLSFLGILEVALDAIDTVYVPHATLGWLFGERQKAEFHQPSRIRDAHKVRDLVATDVLKKFTPTTAASSDLSAQVGDELAAFIAEAEKIRDGDCTQYVVVRPAPVHRLSSLMEEEADLSAHAAVLSSCLAVVEKLRQKGQVSAAEEKRARTYLQLHEKPWANQPAIADGATLYLDDLAISYLLHLGLLGKLKAAGLTAVASPREVSEADALISYERISEEVKNVIEGVRTSLNFGIESGRVRVGRRYNFDGFEEKSISGHPTVGILALASYCDAWIIDDRFLNQHANIDNGGAQTPVFSTLDLLDGLVAAGAITDDDRLEYRTRLRQAGYFFVPVTEDELERCLRGSTLADGDVVETAELKAIRESVLRVRMSDWLQLPDEAPWLDGTLKAFVRVLRILWVDGADIEETTVRSNWLVEQIDIRGWAHSLVPENADDIVRIGRAAHVLLLLMPLTGVQQSVEDAYCNWVEEGVLAPIKEQFPEVFEWIVNWYRRRIAEMADTQLRGQLVTNAPLESAVITSAALKFVPPLIGKRLLDDQSFREEYGLKTEALLSFGSSGVSLHRSELYDAVRTVLAGETPAELKDAEKQGRTWHLIKDANEDELPNLVLSSGQQRLVMPELSVLSEDVSTRIRSLEKYALDLNLPAGTEEKWRSILEERSLEDDEVDAFLSDIRDTPVYVERTIRSVISAGQGTVSSLVPNSRRYFERLVGVYDGSRSIQDYAAGAGRAFLSCLSEWQPYEGFLFGLFLSSHSALTAEINVDHLEPAELEKAFDFLEEHGDSLSRLGALEVGLRVVPDRPEIEPFLLRLVRRIQGDDVEGEASEFRLLSALFVLVDGELARTRLLAEQPPFYRRLASLAQAALIHRQLVQSGVNYNRFTEWALSSCGEYFYIQSLADMRTAPRWNPDLAAAPQIKADFFGRILFAGGNFRENLGDGELRDTVLIGGNQSLINLCEFPRPFLPGPLEGAEDSSNALPDVLARTIEEQLDMEEVEASSFIALVNSALIFNITSRHAELAAKALRLGNYTLANLASKSELVGILNGLAAVAAVSRNTALADELRILVRRYRRDSQYSFTIKEAVRMCLVASAAREDLMEWRRFAGEWLTELAFGHLEGNEGAVLHSHILALLHSVPELWVSCARADAALESWCCR